MAITYTWVNAESTALRYVDDSTAPDTVLIIPVSADNRHYQEYLTWVAAGNTAFAYVAPPEPTPLTAEEKLANAGLTVAELQELLGL